MDFAVRGQWTQSRIEPSCDVIPTNTEVISVGLSSYVLKESINGNTYLRKVDAETYDKEHLRANCDNKYRSEGDNI